MFEWEKPQVGQLFDEIRGLSLVPDFDDLRVWRDGEPPVFSVKSAYGVLRGYSEGNCQICINFSGVLRLYLRPRFWRGGCWKTRLLLKSTWHDAG